MITKQKLAGLVTGVVALSTAIMPFAASAQNATNTSTTTHQRAHGHVEHAPTYTGRVSAVNGNTFTLVRGAKTFTVDVSHATIASGFGKQRTTLSAADITTSDYVMVGGTLSDTNIAAVTVNVLNGKDFSRMMRSMHTRGSLTLQKAYSATSTSAH